MKKSFLLTMSLMFTLVFSSVSHAAIEALPDKPIISKGRYITGGVLASSIGLGIGHAVQDRYLYKGLLFSATEVAGIALLAGANCSSHRRDDAQRAGNHSDEGDCDNGGQAVLGAAMWLGFHVWEIIDIWTAVRPYDDDEPKTSAMILPSKDGPMLALTYKF